MSKRKMFWVVLVFVVLAMSSLACGGSGSVDAADKTTETTAFTAEETEAYWEEANDKAKLREEAIRRDAVVIEWRGDWDADAHLALFYGQGHKSDVKVGCRFLDLIEKDQWTLKENKGDGWTVIVNIPNNLQIGGTMVFVAGAKIAVPAEEQVQQQAMDEAVANGKTVFVHNLGGLALCHGTKGLVMLETAGQQYMWEVPAGAVEDLWLCSQNADGSFTTVQSVCGAAPGDYLEWNSDGQLSWARYAE